MPLELQTVQVVENRIYEPHEPRCAHADQWHYGHAGYHPQKPAGSGKVDDCLDKINLSASHLLALVNDVLDMNKLESGKETIESVS